MQERGSDVLSSVPRLYPRPLVCSVLAGQDTAAGPDSGCHGCGASAPASGKTTSPEPGAPGCAGTATDPNHLLPAGCPECPGDHLAPTGHAGAVAGRGWGCAPSHSRFSCPTGHLYVCQGMGTGSAGKRLGTQTHRGSLPLSHTVGDRWGPKQNLVLLNMMRCTYVPNM